MAIPTDTDPVSIRLTQEVMQFIQQLDEAQAPPGEEPPSDELVGWFKSELTLFSGVALGVYFPEYAAELLKQHIAIRHPDELLLRSAAELFVLVCPIETELDQPDGKLL